MTGGAPGPERAPRPEPEAGPDELQFRSLAAPGLEEDDVFAALHGLPVPGPFWGEGWPAAPHDPERPWDEDAERRRRHERLLAKWREERDDRDERAGPPGAAGPEPPTGAPPS